MNYSSIIMEYQKLINLLENTPNHPSKSKTKNQVEVNDELRGTYNNICTCECNYNSPKQSSSWRSKNRKNVTIKNYAPFTNCIIQINSSQIDNAKDINIVMPMYSFTEYSDK